MTSKNEDKTKESAAKKADEAALTPASPEKGKDASAKQPENEPNKHGGTETDGKEVKTEGPKPATNNKTVETPTPKENPNVGSSEGTKPAESEGKGTPSNDPDVEKDHGAGGVRATQGNQSLKPVATPGTPNSPDSTTRDIPAEASKKEAAALSESPSDNKEENYGEDDPADPYDPYNEMSKSDEKDIERQLDKIDEREEAIEKGHHGYMSKGPQDPKKASAVKRYLLNYQNKPDETVVYGYGGDVITLGDLRGDRKISNRLAKALRKKGKKDNFAIAAGLTLGDLDGGKKASE